MGLLDTWRDFRANQRGRSFEKMGDLLKNQVTTKEQRWEAIEGLASGGDFALAAPQLMKRFELVVDHGIVDKREKDRVVEILIENSEVARPLRSCSQTEAYFLAYQARRETSRARAISGPSAREPEHRKRFVR